MVRKTSFATRNKRPRLKRRGPDPRAHGTRQHLLEAAGRIFAEKGFDRATSKEICQMARANIAAVNYHFGGIDNLYAAVLEAAHDRLFSLEAMSAAVAEQTDARAKLSAVLELLVQNIVGSETSSWAMRVIGREISAPSPAMTILREKHILPKSRIMRQIVGELTNLPPDHPTVARGCISIMGPCMMLLIVSRRTLRQVFPSLGLDSTDAPAMARHMLRFCLAGLAAIAAEAHTR